MDDIKKDQLKPYVVLGTGSLNKMEKSFDKLAKQNSRYVSDFDDVKDDINDVKGKLPSLQAIKSASEAAGNALTSQQAFSLMDSIRTNVIDATTKVKMQVMSTFAPLDVEIKQTLDLLNSNLDVNQDKALDKIDKLRKGMNVDFERVAEAMGANVKELIAQREFMRNQRREEKEIEDTKKENSLRVRDELRERGINTYVDKQTNTLKLMTNREEKAFKKEIISDEKRLKEIEQKLLFDQKEFKRNDTMTADEREKRQQQINNDQLVALDLIKSIDKRKEEAGIKPEEKQSRSGFFSQSFGQAGSYLKQTGLEVMDMGKKIVKGFGALPGLLKSFTVGLIGAIVAFIPFILIAIAIVAAIALIIYYFKELKEGIVAVIDFIKNLNPFADDAEDQGFFETDNAYKDRKASEAAVTNADSKLSATQQGMQSDAAYNTNTNTNNAVTNNQSIIPGITPVDGNASIQPIMKNENVYSESKSFASGGTGGKNAVVIEGDKNMVTNNNSSTVVSNTPHNRDTSFLNLSTVPV